MNRTFAAALTLGVASLTGIGAAAAATSAPDCTSSSNGWTYNRCDGQATAPAGHVAVNFDVYDATHDLQHSVAHTTVPAGVTAFRLPVPPPGYAACQWDAYTGPRLTTVTFPGGPGHGSVWVAGVRVTPCILPTPTPTTTTTGGTPSPTTSTAPSPTSSTSTAPTTTTAGPTVTTPPPTNTTPPTSPVTSTTSPPTPKPTTSTTPVAVSPQASTTVSAGTVVSVPTHTTTPSPTTTYPLLPVNAGAPELPKTGNRVPVGPIAWAGVGLIAGGLGLAVWGRRREQDES